MSNLYYFSRYRANQSERMDGFLNDRPRINLTSEKSGYWDSNNFASVLLYQSIDDRGELRDPSLFGGGSEIYSSEIQEAEGKFLFVPPNGNSRFNGWQVKPEYVGKIARVLGGERSYDYFTFDIEVLTPRMVTVYSRGSYIDQVTGSFSQYPANGRQGSYWYVRQGLANQTPETPSYINVPTSTKSGDAVNVSWGIAEDDNLSGYVLERSINGGSWSEVYRGADRSYHDTALSNWNTVKYRVKGYDPYTSGSYKTSTDVAITHNSAPIISGTDQDLGTKNSTFEQTFRVDDPDKDQTLKVKVTLNGVLLQEYQNATRNQDYIIRITDEQIREFEVNRQNTINISASDGTVSVERNYYFTRRNQAPEVTVSNANLGEQNEPFRFNFSATDADGDKITAKVYLNGVQVADLGNIEDGKDIAYKLERTDFMGLKNGEHRIRIDVRDEVGSMGSGFITFTKKVTWYQYDYKAEIPYTVRDIRVDMFANLREGTIKKIEVCNNAMDEEPTWEVIEDGVWDKFENNSKTASSWGLGVRVRVDRGEAKEDSHIYGFNVSYV